jgi:cytochrome oxidase assembly protein ShyY1
LSTHRKTFLGVARQPKYIGGLVFAMLMAAAFAWLGQWQLDRAINKNEPTQAQLEAKVTLEVSFDQRQVYIVDGRLQDGKSGYWVLQRAVAQDGKSVTVALGYTDTLIQAEAARFQIQSAFTLQALQKVSGVWLPSEEPKKLDAHTRYLLHSVSIPQLINLYSPDAPIETYPQFLKLCRDCQPYAGAYEVKQITGLVQPAGSINWLSAFYAVEWIVFAGFAFFLWYRTVKDAVLADS